MATYGYPVHPTTSSLRRRAALAAIAVLALLASACSATETDPETTTPGVDAAPAAAETTSFATADLPIRRSVKIGPDLAYLARQAELARLAAIPDQRRPEPINVVGSTTAWQAGVPYRGIFADPDITYVGDGKWLAYSTNTSNQHLPTLVTTNLSTWMPITGSNGGRYDPLPQVGDWVQGNGGGDGLWAPSVAKIGDHWVMAYSAGSSGSGDSRHNCIGLAVSSYPGGIFNHLGPAIECAPESRLGAIDPDLYVDPNGTPWMLWKFSGIHNRAPSALYSRQLNAEGTAYAEGSSTNVLITHQPGWEGNTIENPSMINFRGVYYLFFSGNAFTTANYATGYAICAGPAGPCQRPSTGPLLSSASTGHLGPGGASAFNNDGALQLIYHAWDPGRVNQLRSLRIAGLYQNGNGTLEVVDAG